MGVDYYASSRDQYFSPYRRPTQYVAGWQITSKQKGTSVDLTGKYYVDNETGEIFEVIDKVDAEKVMVKEYDVKGAGSAIVHIEDLTAPHVRFFDGVMDAQKFVLDNFEDSEETANG
jgi:hypothetical protein